MGVSHPEKHIKINMLHKFLIQLFIFLFFFIKAINYFQEFVLK